MSSVMSKAMMKVNQNPTNLSKERIKQLRITQFMMDHMGVAFVEETWTMTSGFMNFNIDLSAEFYPNEVYIVMIETWQQMEEIEFLFTQYGRHGIIARECLKRGYRVNDYIDRWGEHKVEVVKNIIKRIKTNHRDIITWA